MHVISMRITQYSIVTNDIRKCQLIILFVKKHITGFGHIFENIPMEHFAHHTANSHIQQ